MSVGRYRNLSWVLRRDGHSTIVRIASRLEWREVESEKLGRWKLYPLQGHPELTL